MMTKAIRARYAVVVLQVLMMLGLGGMLMLTVLLIVVQQVRHPSSGPIQPSIVPLLMVLGVHAAVILNGVGDLGGSGGAFRRTARQRQLSCLAAPQSVDGNCGC